MVRHPGRPLKPLDDGLEAPVYAWAAAVRRVVFVPLMSGTGRLTLQTISERLQAMAPGQPGQEPADGAGVLRSGRRERSVQRILAGELVPTRDVVHHLLELVAAECGPVSEQDSLELWAAYRQALALTKPATLAMYEVWDSYAAARMLVLERQGKVESLEAALMQQRARVSQSNDRNRRVQRAASLLRRALASSDRHKRQLQAVNEELEQSASRVRETMAALEVRLSDARGSAADWQELATHLKEQLEHSGYLAVVAEQEQAEREALLLEWLAQACEALETARAQSEKAQAALRWWQQQAERAAADTHAAQVEAARQGAAALAAQEQAERVGTWAQLLLREQQSAFEEFAAQVQADHDRAVQATGHLQEQLRAAHRKLRQARQGAEQANAQLTSLMAERDLLEEFAAQVQADHDRSLRAIDHLQEQLRAAHRELRQAREETVQANAQLASLKAERDLLQEVDAIISLAQAKHRSPGQPALTRFASEPPAAQPSLPPPAPMNPPSPVPGEPTPGKQEPEPARQPAAQPAATPAHEAKTPAMDSSPPTTPGPPPVQDPPAASRQQPAPARQQRPLSVAARGRRIAFVTVPLLCVIGLLTSNCGGSDGSPPGRDTVADLGNQDVNTSAVMKLPACKDGYTTMSLRSDDIHYAPTAQPVFTFTVIGRPGMKCRINAVSTHIRLWVKAVESGTVTWSSRACAPDNPAPRWIAVSHTTPATLTYHWDRAAHTRCNTHAAPPGAYTVSANIQTAIDNDVMASFRLLSE
ncbi:hypothetical protein [Streptomyces aquilus]|uniref:hypothetical protein n=1 Tax=Streptomyces aquilus TaxID=2548456 RepID=UPI0036C66CF2